MTSPDQIASLSITDQFVVTAEKVIHPFTKNMLSGFSQSARDVLNSVIGLEQMASEKPDSNSKSDSPELYRLEQKLDFVTELLTKMIQAQIGLPEKSTLSLNSSSLNWACEQVFQADEYLAVSIHISARYPLPLVLPVRVQRCSAGNVAAEILLTDPDALDDLTRLIFLIHRRQIARNRTEKFGKISS